jgi:hypothetical protein
MPIVSIPAMNNADGFLEDSRARIGAADVTERAIVFGRLVVDVVAGLPVKD